MDGGNRTTRRTALGFIAIGGMLLIMKSAGFTKTTANRMASVRSADDENALLGLTDHSTDARIETATDTTTIYTLNDSLGGLAEENIDVTVVSLVSDDSTLNNPPIEATVSSETAPEFSVTLQCSKSDATIEATYEVISNIVASNGQVSIDLTRTTDEQIFISCAIDYGDSGNYRDEDGRGAAHPEDARGTVTNPSAVSSEDGNSATAISTSGGNTGKVGFKLPTQSARDSYQLRVVTPGRTGTRWETYLLDRDGDELTARNELENGENIFTFDSSENDAIRENHEELYIVFEGGTGNNNELQLDYFELQ
ncbi:hypothetical protein [Natronorubrum tibetense]|uniref:hypothetical protein n=1 Tax=Natronorubrum tibetense TaxID=63128 RepID=UPI00187DA910|nr:hypothetical protein [Natronorubrum tibetense]